MVYAGCVIWPFHLDKKIGLAIGGVIIVASVIQYFVGRGKRLKEEDPT